MFVFQLMVALIVSISISAAIILTSYSKHPQKLQKVPSKNLTIQVCGGLGNQMFEISTAFAYAKKHGLRFAVDKSTLKDSSGTMPTYWKTTFQKLSHLDYDDKNKKITESGFLYQELDDPKDNTELIGYFQSDKYFIEYREELLDLFMFEKIPLPFNTEKENVSLHVRRGDYVGHSLHTNQTVEYYERAVEQFSKDVRLVIFSNDIEWCQSNFNFKQEMFFINDPNLKDTDEMYLMSKCDHNVIANSSFSWWGAWMNKSDKNKVIAPKQWFNIDKIPDWSDIYSENWIIL
jgi:hypothetical protein